ncbi:MAG: hypothetical protein AAFP15_01995 [Bacteroidota bacterium]
MSDVMLPVRTYEIATLARTMLRADAVLVALLRGRDTTVAAEGLVLAERPTDGLRPVRLLCREQVPLARPSSLGRTALGGLQVLLETERGTPGLTEHDARARFHAEVQEAALRVLSSASVADIAVTTGTPDAPLRDSELYGTPVFDAETGAWMTSAFYAYAYSPTRAAA